MDVSPLTHRTKRGMSRPDDIQGKFTIGKGASLPSIALEMPHTPSWKVFRWEQSRKEIEYLFKGILKRSTWNSWASWRHFAHQILTQAVVAW